MLRIIRQLATENANAIDPVMNEAIGIVNAATLGAVIIVRGMRLRKRETVPVVHIGVKRTLTL